MPKCWQIERKKQNTTIIAALKAVRKPIGKSSLAEPAETRLRSRMRLRLRVRFALILCRRFGSESRDLSRRLCGEKAALNQLDILGQKSKSPSGKIYHDSDARRNSAPARTTEMRAARGKE
ncbi:hypothetical protein MBM_09718 [Drepanopeziza brunnea f. sp. 'multigermtubi' MB_m1]|uniref:Uncharacterized protein n=1 Tax=Marssonina brunnea f. sp. multigermtubi (strain MB_m1) TaxID=1072389 RepID=K1WGW9_MARBU|nr:uncharacterized protein MBM_09718 [Drepanopeziza brunnea f. sp. 'multigermtubi' MB_m1]EKD12081.1 hypothetical protein MBM_09718 [Drepanopeziza brunnea f. sp. 'multigermtubi' MB_m1]